MAMDEPARVLVVVDRPVVAETVVVTLNHGLYSARISPTVPDAIRLLTRWRPQLAVVDMDLGDATFLYQLGLAGPEDVATVPVLGLTRRGDLKTKLAAFAQGVDDVITVPFSPEELLARVLAITRRAYGVYPPLRPTIRIGEIEIDILHREVRTNNSVIHLTGLEQCLLYVLAANAGRIVGREEILDGLWGVDFAPDSNIVDRHIRSLRSKLQDDWRHPRYISTIPGRGYRFLLPASEGASRDGPG